MAYESLKVKFQNFIKEIFYYANLCKLQAPNLHNWETERYVWDIYKKNYVKSTNNWRDFVIGGT